MVKRGYADDYHEIPSLDTFKILWNCDSRVIGKHVTGDTFSALVDKTIVYLQGLSLPKCTTKLGLDQFQSTAIEIYLDINPGHNKQGDLRRVIESSQGVLWMRQVHRHRFLPE